MAEGALSSVPTWYVLVLGNRDGVVFEEGFDEEVCETWDEWLQMAVELKVHMADEDFDWCRFAREASENTLAHVVTVKSLENAPLGFFYYVDPYNGRPLKMLFMSVRPDCRECYPRREVRGVGKVALAYVCSESCNLNPGQDLDMGAVLPEAKAFVQGFGALYVTTDGHGDDLYVLPNPNCVSLVEQYA